MGEGLKSELSLNVENLESFQREKDNEIRQLIALRCELETKQKSIETSINSRDENIKGLSEKVASLEKENNFLREKQETEMGSAMLEKDKMLEEIRSELSFTNAKLVESEAKSNQLQTTITTFEQNIKDSSQVIEELTNEKLNMENNIKEKEQTIAEKDKEINKISKDTEAHQINLGNVKKEHAETMTQLQTIIATL